MENVAGEQDLALQQHSPYKTSKFSENSTVVQTYSFIPGGSNLAILVFSMRSFHSWDSLSYSP